MTLDGSKIDSYCGKSVNLPSLYVGYIMAKAPGPNVIKGLGTSQNKVVNLTGLIVTSANILGSVPDPVWIRIQSVQWIRIRIRNPDPDPGRHSFES